MTVGQLLEILKEVNSDLPVLVDGYEYGAHILRTEDVKVTEYRENDWGTTPDWGGPHKILYEWRSEVNEAWDAPKNRVLPCVHIGRRG